MGTMIINISWVWKPTVVSSRTGFRRLDLSGLLGNLWPSHSAFFLAFIDSSASSPSVYLRLPMPFYWKVLLWANGSPHFHWNTLCFSGCHHLPLSFTFVPSFLLTQFLLAFGTLSWARSPVWLSLIPRPIALVLLYWFCNDHLHLVFVVFIMCSLFKKILTPLWCESFFYFLSPNNV